MRKRHRSQGMLLAFVLAAGPLTADAATFDRVIGFATKTGFRGVIAWQADGPVAGAVEYKVNGGPTQTALPLANLVDRAQMAIIDDLPIGGNVSFVVRDQLSGDTSTVQGFNAANAYTSTSTSGSTATLNALMQLDSEALPDAVPFDLGVHDLAAGINVFAERVYDALDGYARIGTVLITDTILDYPLNIPFGPHALIGLDSCALNQNVDGVGAVGHTMADFLVETTIPFDSHTFSGWMIDDPCTAFYIGRLGQLVVPWENDLHLGYTMTHEFMHYAFNAPDLYLLNSDADCRDDTTLPGTWDGSLMHNTGGWNSAHSLGARWELTELDRNPTLTPCDHGTEPYSWDNLRERYLNVPLNPAGPIQDVVNTACRGNPDGGALKIWVLDHEPGSSTLTEITPDDSGPCP